MRALGVAQPQLEGAHDAEHLDVAVHPSARLFPPMSAEAYAALVEDIKEHGQREPITTFRGAIVDGVHRARACRELDIAPATQEFTGTEAELLAYVVSMNLKRRHLDESQRALVATRIANLPEGRPGKETAPNGAVSQTAAASLMNVSRRTVQRAARVVREAPDLVPAIERGELTIGRAAERAGPTKRQFTFRRRPGRPAHEIVGNIVETLENVTESLIQQMGIQPLTRTCLRERPERDDWTRRLRVVRGRISRFINGMEPKVPTE